MKTTHIVRTHTPISRWMNRQMKSNGIHVIVAACMSLTLFTTVICVAYTSNARRDNVLAQAVEFSNRFNSRTEVGAPQDFSRAMNIKGNTDGLISIDCGGDQLELSMVYDDQRKTWVDILAFPKHKKSSTRIKVLDNQTAISISFQSIKAAHIIPTGGQIRVTGTRFFELPRLWDVNWEVMPPNGQKYPITTQIDACTGFPTHIHHGSY